MPWKDVNPIQEKQRFATLANTWRYHVSDLRLDFGSSRKTRHKYIRQYDSIGLAGLKEAGRRPKSSPNCTDATVEKLALAGRRLHRRSGPKKIREILQSKRGLDAPPSRDGFCWAKGSAAIR